MEPPLVVPLVDLEVVGDVHPVGQFAGPLPLPESDTVPSGMIIRKSEFKVSPFFPHGPLAQEADVPAEEEGVGVSVAAWLQLSQFALQFPRHVCQFNLCVCGQGGDQFNVGQSLSGQSPQPVGQAVQIFVGDCEACGGGVSPVADQQAGALVQCVGNVELRDGAAGAPADPLTHFDDDGGAVELVNQPAGDQAHDAGPEVGCSRK